MEILKKIYAWLDGNKTILCTVLWLLIVKGVIPLSPELQSVVEYILMALTGGALADHVRKGYLTTAKGD